MGCRFRRRGSPVCASDGCPPPTAGLISRVFDPRNSKMALFVPKNCPRNSKRGLFVTFNDNFYLRNRKLLLRSSRLRLGNVTMSYVTPW
nr:MAG TPA: hypothetical protein [Caudoviricetes sp.]